MNRRESTWREVGSDPRGQGGNGDGMDFNSMAGYVLYLW